MKISSGSYNPKIPVLLDWLGVATKMLAPYAKERIAAEIEAHYAEAVRREREGGASPEVAHERVMASLGDPEKARKKFEKEHLTEKESWQIEKYLNYVDGGFRWFDLLSFLIFIPYYYFLGEYSLAGSIQISFAFGAIYIIFTHGIASYYLNKNDIRKVYLFFNMAVFIPFGFMFWISNLNEIGYPHTIFVMVELLLFSVWIVRKYYRKIPDDYEWDRQ
jgi:hypothetical protein